VARLPQPGGDNGKWGDILNDYLLQALKPDGTIKDDAVTSNAIAPNAVTADQIADGAVAGEHIQDGVIAEAQLDTNVQEKLNTAGSGGVADGTITTAKLHDDAVTDSKVSPTAGIAQSKITDLVTDLAGKAATSHTHVATDISDSSSVGRAVLTATDAAAARSAIGAGTSNLALGTTASTAKAGNYAPAWTDVTSKPTAFTPSDADTASLIGDGASTTRSTLDALYTVPAEVQTGAAPVATVHSDAGTGASIASGGTRIALRVSVTTGISPVSGGSLATFALTGYTLAPVVAVNPRDETSLSTFPYATTTETLLTLRVGGELEPATTYTYDIIVLGV